MQSENLNELATALAKAQAEIKGAIKDATNPHFKSSYADLASIWDACRAPLSKNGLSVTQTMHETEGRIMVVTTLLHASGQWMRGTLPINAVKQDPQGIGSAITYARRYSLSAMVGVAPDDDDDGEAAVDRSRNAPVPPRTSPPPQPRAQGPVINPLKPPVSGAHCDLCHAELILSDSRVGYYCPNHKDKTKGSHTQVMAADIDAFIASRRPTPPGPHDPGFDTGPSGPSL